MKQIFFLLLLVFTFFSCKNEPENLITENSDQLEEIEISYKSFGGEVSENEFITKTKLSEIYKSISLGDTIDLKIMADVKEVCKKKGCWMLIDLDEEEAMIRFKDYGFFMPDDIEGKTVIAEGKAFIEEMSVDAQRHYAEDGGASAEEVLAITDPKITYTFMAHGVLVPEL